jgi:hypothetical protein
MLRPAAILLVFDGVIRIDPGSIATQDGIDPLEPLSNQNLRRTGAGFFRRSGTVSDDPLVRVQLTNAGF